jgi:hypothetical protein
VEHGEVVDATFLVAGRDPPGLLEAVEQTLDLVALSLSFTVEVGLARLVFPGRDHRADVATAPACACGRTAVALVPGGPARPQPRTTSSGAPDRPLIQHRFEGELLMPLAPGQHHRDRPSVACRAPMHLGRKPTLAAT